jgi:mediator of RNA polymerase II transcription subunit 14
MLTKHRKQTENTRSVTAHLNLQLTKGQPDLSDTFWDNLTLFAAGIISHYGEISQLHRIGIKYRERAVNAQPLPQQVNVPSLLLSLSDILALPARVAGEHTVTPRPSWAENKVEILYNGLRHDASDDTESGARMPLGTTVVALVRVTDRSGFKQLPGQVDKDVSFNKRTGQFRFLMRGSVGVPIMEQLAGHVRSVDRLVALLEAIRGARGSLKVVDVGLRQAKFTYPDVQPTGSSEEPRQWTAILDMSGSKARLVLEDDNPHLRLLNYLNKLANTEGGLSVLMAYLVEILPLLKAADYIDEKWAGLDTESSVHVTIIPRGADWFVYRYELVGANDQKRRLCLDLRSRNREGTGFWVLKRGNSKPDDEEDDLDGVLRKVFDNRGDLWRGFSKSAAAVQGGVGVLNMLIATDEAIRTYAQGGDLAAVEAALKALPSPVRISEVASFPSMPQPQPQPQQDRRASHSQAQPDRRPSQSQGQTLQDRRQSMGHGQQQQMRLSQVSRPPQGQRQNSSNKPSGTKDTPFVLD